MRDSAALFLSRRDEKKRNWFLFSSYSFQKYQHFIFIYISCSCAWVCIYFCPQRGLPLWYWPICWCGTAYSNGPHSQLHCWCHFKAPHMNPVSAISIQTVRQATTHCNRVQHLEWKLEMDRQSVQEIVGMFMGRSWTVNTRCDRILTLQTPWDRSLKFALASR